MNTDLYTAQEEIEKQSRAATIQRFEQELNTKIQRGDQSSTYFGTALIKRAIEPISEIINKNTKAAKKGKAMNAGIAFKYIEKLDADVVAYLTCRVIIDRIVTNSRIQDVALRIGQACEDELRYHSFDAQHPWLFKKIQAETDTTRKRRRETFVAAYNRYCQTWASWTKQDKLHVGMKMISIFMDATGFVEEVRVLRAKNRTDIHLKATDAVVKFIEDNKDIAGVLNPMHVPMVVPPKDWSSPITGGYLTYYTPQLPFIKVRGNLQSRNYLEDLQGNTKEMSEVYDAINTIQRTPWRVNSFVLETFNQIHELNLPVAGLPSREDIPKPPSPLAAHQDSSELTDDEKQKFKRWKKKVTTIYEENLALKSKRLMTAKIASIADRFQQYEAIYFPHTMDFRGRAYPAPMYLNPQGNSLSKGLLEFAAGKPLGTDDAVCELAVHGANCFGYDKCSMDERIDWVEENTQRILQVATDPMADLWWAKEADDPWCFLAFCYEWNGFHRHGHEHISHIPIAKDGSCSGLQHFSAALRDPVGGQAVNLIPTNQPEDIYQKVIDLAVVKISADLGGDNDSIAQACLNYGLSRKAAKRMTMCRVYGSTLYSGRQFLSEYITDTDTKRRQEDLSYTSPLDGLEFEAALYLAKHIWDSINETVIAAKDGMAWLQNCARILATENLPISWTTIDGFPVMQSYPDTKRRRIKTKLGDKMVYLSLREEKIGKMDRKKQSNGISPNVVHSLDSCHLRMTVNLARYNGVTHFAMIHDSFGCHASDIPMLSACLREAFIDLYVANDPFELFRLQTQELTDTVLPMPPTKGSLDLTDVRKSEFFFA
jgi:DNA-directed RNA polymerase, mitochondrial|tara:strand:+ start:130 stop:2607 length:2478 start_codon:yes stop_codon:yes gene_type:complete